MDNSLPDDRLSVEEADAPPPLGLRHGLRGLGAFFAWAPFGRSLAVLRDANVLLWNPSERIQTFVRAQSDPLENAAWSHDGRIFTASAFSSKRRSSTIYAWTPHQGREAQALVSSIEGRVSAAVWNPSALLLAFSSTEGHLAVWDLVQGTVSHALDLDSAITNIAWAPDGASLALATWNGALSFWTPGPLQSDLRAIQVHYRTGKQIVSLAWSPTAPLLAAGSTDDTVRIVIPSADRPFHALEGHTDVVRHLSFSADGNVLASKADDGFVQLWRSDTWERIASFGKPRSLGALAFHPREPLLAAIAGDPDVINVWDVDLDALLEAAAPAPTVQYANAKVLLVGDSGVGKSGLGLALAGRTFAATESTHGRYVWSLGIDEARMPGGRRETRETLLWDLAGQPGYRVFHRQHLNEVAVALVLFDSKSETDPFAGVAYWSRALDDAAQGFPLVKFLVASRIDRGGPSVSHDRIREICERFGFASFSETSAKRGDGIASLLSAITTHITWNAVPRVSSPQLFKDSKEFIIAEKEAGRVVQRRTDLYERYRLTGQGNRTPSQVFETCLGRIEAAGLVKRLTFGDLVLLQPEMLDDYCSWLAQRARAEPDGLGFISEHVARSGSFPMDHGRPLEDREEERLLLAAAIEDIVRQGIALRQMTDLGGMLVFPSEVRTDMPEYPGTYTGAVSFTFEGPVAAIYATLAVCLAHAPAFSKEMFFKNAAVFRSAGNELCGFSVEYNEPMNDVAGRLVVFFGMDTGKTTKMTFLRYVNRQLEQMAFRGSVQRERVYYCECGFPQPIAQAAVAWRRDKGLRTVVCSACAAHVSIDDLAEETGRTDPVVERQIAASVEEMGRQGRLSIFAEREQRNEYHVFLCHNQLDKPSVRVLLQRLREHGILPWIDEDGLLSGHSFVGELEAVMYQVPAAAVIIGPRALGRWQRQEYYVFVQRHVEGRRMSGQNPLSLIPVLLPGAAEDSVPAFLRGIPYVDFRDAGLNADAPLRALVRAIVNTAQ